jgi:hypothetical protein
MTEIGISEPGSLESEFRTPQSEFHTTFVMSISTMKNTSKTLLAFTLLIVTAALYRIIPGRPFGFEPMIAMAIFGGAVIADKKWAFAIPLAAMLVSDALYEALTRAHVVNMPGFYKGQAMNYLLIGGITLFGIFMKRVTVVNVATAAIIAPLVYFVLSNTGTWAFHGGYQRPITFSGWMQAVADGLPFLKWSLLSSVAFSGVLFGAWYALKGAGKVQPQGISA